MTEAVGINVYDIGDTVRAAGEFRSADLILGDPDTVTLEICDPEGNVDTFVYLTDDELVRDSTGKYHADIVPSLSGMYYCRWVITGLITAVESWQFMVQKNTYAVPLTS